LTAFTTAPFYFSMELAATLLFMTLKKIKFKRSLALPVLGIAPILILGFHN
jgi:ABC-type enterochelin transport system permease subunit